MALSDYQNDVKISPQILKQVGEHYLKLRNTIRFLLANTQGLKKLDFSHLSAIDVWILEEAKKVFSEIDDLFSHYEFSKGFQILNGFITAILSGIYLDICKDSLYLRLGGIEFFGKLYTPCTLLDSCPTNKKVIRRHRCFSMYVLILHKRH